MSNLSNFLTPQGGRDCRTTGEMGEHRVIAELLSRGFKPFVPVIDEGTDILLDTGVKIQIKSSHKMLVKSRGYNYDKYQFATTNKKQGGVWKHQDNSKIDYYILWCVEDDMFFIIPYNECPKFAISFSADARDSLDSKYSVFLENWELLRR